MARIRTIKPEFWRSPSTAKASPWARLLYIAMWNWADDWGRAEWTPMELLAFAFPHDAELPSFASEFPSLVKEVSDTFSVTFYKCRGRRFYTIDHWDDYQKTERRAKSRVPLPDDPECDPDYGIYASVGSAAENRGNSEATQGSSSPGSRNLEVGSRKRKKIDSFADAQESCANPDSSLAQVGAAELRDPYPDDFEVFWSIYPIKRGKGKALKAWKRAIARSSKESINAGAARYRDDPNRKDQFTKYAEGWLNADSWNDEPLPARDDERQTNGLSDAQWQRAYERAEVYDQEHERPATIVEGVWEAS